MQPDHLMRLCEQCFSDVRSSRAYVVQLFVLCLQRSIPMDGDGRAYGSTVRFFITVITPLLHTSCLHGLHDRT